MEVKKHLLLLTILIPLIQLTKAQSFMGVHSSNYDALKSQPFNAALPAASKMKWQVNLLGLDFTARQNYFTLEGSIGDLISDFDRETSLSENLSESTADINLTTDLFGPGFMFGNKKVGAITFNTRARVIVDLSDVSTDFLTSIYNDANNIYNWVNDIEDASLTANVHGFAEIGLGYSRLFELGDRHVIGGGINIKLLSKIAAGVFEANNLGIEIDSIAETANFGNTHATSLTSDIIDQIENEDYNFSFGIDGVGFDLGVVYMFKRKDNDALINNGKQPKKKRVNPDYLFKVGVGVNDIGRLEYNLSEYSRSFQADGDPVALSAITESDSSFTDFDEVLDTLGTFTTPTGTFKASLPTHLSIFFDVKLHRLFFVNFSTSINIGTSSSDKAKAQIPNNFSLTPRFELPQVGIYAPMTFNKNNGFEMGASLRFSHFIIGSNNLLSQLWRKEATGLNLQFAMAFGGVHKDKNKKAKKSKKGGATTSAQL